MRMRYIPILALGCFAILFASCKKKEVSQDIIIKKVVKKAAPTTRKMSESSWKKVMEWGGNSYTIDIHRVADTDLPIVQDEQQNKYYDNRITLKITRADGSIFLDHTFVKADFANLVDDKYDKNGALLGLAFDCIENNSLRFGASVGSPDAMSDEFIPITVTVTRSGEIKSERDTQLDA